MDARMVVLPIFLLLLAGLVLWFTIGTRGRWALKLLMIIVTLSSTLAVWRSLGTYQGWPTADQLPDNFQLVAAEVLEPGTPNSGPYGMIFLWVRGATGGSHTMTTLGYKTTYTEPRAYRLLYTRDLHEQIVEMQKLLCDGRPVFGSRDSGAQEGSEEGSEDGTPQPGRGDGNEGDSSEMDESDVRLYELPPVAPSLKNLQ